MVPDSGHGSGHHKHDHRIIISTFSTMSIIITPVKRHSLATPQCRNTKPLQWHGIFVQLGNCCRPFPSLSQNRRGRRFHLESKQKSESSRKPDSRLKPERMLIGVRRHPESKKNPSGIQKAFVMHPRIQ
jgi:hypothetical protein